MNFKAYTDCYKTIGRMAFPLLLGQLGNITVSFADNIMVGHYSTAALASASFVNNTFNVAIFACVGFTYGLTPIIGALFARGDNDKIGRTVRQGLLVNTIFTLAVSLMMLILYFNVHRLGQPADLLPLIRPYFLTVLAGMIPVAIFNVLAQWSFALNRTGLPSWILIGGNAINILGNYMLISGNWGAPELGLLGAGISTLTSRILCMAVMAGVFFYGRTATNYRPAFFHSRSLKGETGSVFKTGFPVSMQMTFETASFSGSAIMAGWLGTVPLAAYQVVVISGMLGFCIYYSIGAAMAIPVSHAAGAADSAQMRRWAWAGYHMILAAMLVACAVFIFGGRHIMGLFTTDSAVLALAVSLIVPMVLYQFGDATQISFANAMRGTSKVMPMLWIAFVSYIVFGLPLTAAMAFPLGMGLYGIVLSFSACLLLAAALYLTYFLRATRRKS